MPTCRINFSLLRLLVGRSLDLKELRELLYAFKGELQGTKDAELAIELTSDRPDLMCASGLARAFRGYLNLQTGSPTYPSASTNVSISMDGKTLVHIRPYCYFLIVSGLSLTDDMVRDILGYQEKLHQVLSHRREKFAIGIHDLSRLKSCHLEYGAVPSDSIRFTPLLGSSEMTAKEILETTEKGKEYAFLMSGKRSFPLLRSDIGEVLSMPPVINSNLTEVTRDTKEVLIDTTGSDEMLTRAACYMVAYSLADYGGSIARPKLNWLLDGTNEQTLELTSDYASKVLGKRYSADKIVRLLSMARIDSSTNGEGRVVAHLPPYRVDVLHGVDLVEEIAMMDGYSSVKPEYPKVSTIGGLHPSTLIAAAARHSLASQGFIEYAGLMLSSSARMRALRIPHKLIEVANPYSEQTDCVRPLLFPQLLDVVMHNQTKPKPLTLSTVGAVAYLAGDRYVQKVNAAAVLCDNIAESSSVTRYLHRLTADLGEPVSVKPRPIYWLADNRSAMIYRAGRVVGYIGEFRPEILVAHGIDYPVALFETTIYEFRFKKFTF